MLGAIIGDIAGSRFEFNNTKSAQFDLFAPGCSFTDDTICTVAIADAILNGRGYKESVMNWCRKYPRPMGGYGGSFAAWVQSDDPKPYYSFGNGSAMRVSPVGWLFYDDMNVEVEAARTAEITHNHPEGIRGAQVVALCVFMLRNGFPKEHVERFANREYGVLPEYRPFSNPFDETCMNAVPIAISCFLSSTDFEDAIRKSIIVGGDSDTIGAITGSLAEAHYGIPAEMRARAMSYLPKDMTRIVEQFYRCVNGTK